jgi:uncharacterized phage protein (TIGR01671 family)
MSAKKFRAWDAKRKRFGYVTLNPTQIGWPQINYFAQHLQQGYDLGSDQPNICGVLFEDVEDWQQFTGLRDKNGKEIYEGDIVRFRTHLEKMRIMQVGYNDLSCRFTLTDKDGWHTFAHFNHLEVIGNIYENPELLK